MKFRFMRAIAVNGMKHERKRSATAKLTKYLSCVDLARSREEIMMNNAAELPRKAMNEMKREILLVIHSASLTFDGFDRTINDTFRVNVDRQTLVDIFFSRRKRLKTSNYVVRLLLRQVVNHMRRMRRRLFFSSKLTLRRVGREKENGKKRRIGIHNSSLTSRHQHLLTFDILLFY